MEKLVVKEMAIFSGVFLLCLFVASLTNPSSTIKFPLSPQRAVWPAHQNKNQQIDGPRKLIDTKVDGPNTSQMVWDPWSFTHVTHGILGYLIFRAICYFAKLRPKKYVAKAFLIMFGVELSWEMIENSNFVVNRYRKTYREYKGDSSVNSLGDIFSCLAGFFMASWNVKVALVYILVSEILLWPNGLIGGIASALHPPKAAK